MHDTFDYMNRNFKRRATRGWWLDRDEDDRVTTAQRLKQLNEDSGVEDYGDLAVYD